MLGINASATWKIFLTGRPEAIKHALDRYGEKLEEPGKSDFLRSRDTLETLIDLNARTKHEISFAANGDKDHTSVILMTSPATHVD